MPHPPPCTRPRRASRWRAGALPITLILLGGLAGCGADEERIAAAEALAADLAGALTDGELGSLPIAGGGQEELDGIVSGMGDGPEVVAGEVEVDGDTAQASLGWTWPVPGEPWRYETSAELAWVEDRWRVQWSPTLVEPSLAAGEGLELATEQPARGDILGAGDVPLVTDRPVVRFGIDKVAVGEADAEASARELARLLDIDPVTYAERVEGAGEKAFVEALVLRARQAEQVDEAALGAIPGAVGLEDMLPLAPTRDFAAPLLGRVGPATAEVIEASEGQVRRGDEVGLSGLQARYDDLLGGTPAVVVTAAAQEQERTLLTRPAVPGQPLRTTLEPADQGAAERALAEVGPPSAVVVLRPSTGEVLAAASGPGSKGYSTATVGQYAPGSTAKVVTALALMRAGVAPSDPVPCTPQVVVDGKVFTNYSDYPADRTGQITLQSAVANSCNTALISQHALLGDDDLAGAAAALGLGVDHDLGFPAYLGQVPPPTSETGKAASMIGQGTVQASPLAMAAVAASVAGGRAVLPELLPDHDVTQVPPDQPLTEQEADALRAMMRAVVTEGTATFLRDLPGPPVGAKTGTAEYGTGTPPRTHAWMIATQGDLAVAVFVEDGESGSGTAGPILEEVLRALG